MRKWVESVIAPGVEGFGAMLTNMEEGAFSDECIYLVLDLKNQDFVSAVESRDKVIWFLLDWLTQDAEAMRLIKCIEAYGIDYLKHYDLETSLSMTKEVIRSLYGDDDFRETIRGFERELKARDRQRRRDARANTKSGDVYLIEAYLGEDRYHKIGWAKKATNRINVFEVKLPFDFDFLHAFPADDARQAESALHDKYSHCRVNGEWFDLSDQDVATLRRVSKFENREFLWGDYANN